MDFYKLAIKQLIKETDKAVSIAFEVPEGMRSNFSFTAGQYITLKTVIDDEEIRRDYSLCSTPMSGDLKVVIKEVEGGVFSHFANNILKIGDIIEVAPPNGRFTYQIKQEEESTIVAFAAGSGITPIMSIIKTVLEQEHSTKMVLVYGNKTPNDTIFYQELLQLAEDYEDRFALKFVFSQSNEDNALFGRIETSTINYIINQTERVSLFYICGPETMIQNVENVLLEKGVNKDAIKFELFTTKTEASSNDSINVKSGNAVVTVMVDDEETTFVMPQSKTILEAALENDIDAPYSCQGGICSTCIARLTSGEAVMRQNNILTDGELAEGLILTCQAQPTTSTVNVDYDDV